MRKTVSLLGGFVLVLLTLPMVRAQEGYPQPVSLDIEQQCRPEAEGTELNWPSGVAGTESLNWSDSFDGDCGFSGMDQTVAVNGEVTLTQIVPLPKPAAGSNVLAMAEGLDGRIYLGTSGAYLNVYHPVTGSMTSLGVPVPDEVYQ